MIKPLHPFEPEIPKSNLSWFTAQQVTYRNLMFGVPANHDPCSPVSALLLRLRYVNAVFAENTVSLRPGRPADSKYLCRAIYSSCHNRLQQKTVDILKRNSFTQTKTTALDFTIQNLAEIEPGRAEIWVLSNENRSFQKKKKFRITAWASILK
jgi:hypothetical protein